MSSAQVRRVYALSDPVPMIPLLPFLFFGALVWAAIKLVGGGGTAPAAA